MGRHHITNYHVKMYTRHSQIEDIDQSSYFELNWAELTSVEAVQCLVRWFQDTIKHGIPVTIYFIYYAPRYSADFVSIKVSMQNTDFMRGDTISRLHFAHPLHCCNSARYHLHSLLSLSYLSQLVPRSRS